MPIKVTCNSCGGVLHAPDDAAGKRGRCPTCGMILSIPADAPRVAADNTPSATPTPSGAGPSQAYGLAPGPDPLAFPKPPSFGSDISAQKSSTFGSHTAGAVPPGRLPPDPRQFGNAVFKSPSPQQATANAAERKWARVDRGLGLVRWGIVCCILGVIAPTGIVILEQNGMGLPHKDGLLGAPGLSFTDEIKVGSTLAFLLLGGLFVVLGRFRVAAAPRDTGSRSVGRAAALSTFLAYLGFLTVVVFLVSAAVMKAPTLLVPKPDVLAPKLWLPERISRYADQAFLPKDDFMGQTQRFGALAFFAAGFVAELWFLGTLSRLAVALRNDRAIARVNRFAILAGTVMILLAFAWLAYDLFGHDWKRDNFDPKWNAMPAGQRISLRAGIAAGVFAVAGFIYTRSLRGIRNAIGEAK